MLAPLAVAVLVLACWWLFDGTRLVLAGIVVVAGLATFRMLARDRAAKRADRRSAEVLEACEAMASDLAAGQPPALVLARVAADWPELAPASAAARLDADVPGALRVLARADGAEELRTVAAAWQVAHHSGSGLAQALDRAAATIRARHRTRQVVATELAAANATARMMALLPLGVLVLGSGLGVDPWAFLLDTPFGLGCLGAGVALALAGMAWIQRIAAEVR